MMKIATAAYPLEPVQGWQAYADKLRDWVADAAAQGADLLLFPEYGAMELAMVDGPEAAGDLERARCVLARAPEHLRERDPELRAVHAVLAAMLDRDQPAVHAAAGAHAWSPRCAPLAASLIERYRAATLDLLSRAYTTASCAHVAACLGVSVEEAAAQGVGMGWSLGEDGMFGVVRRKVDDEAEALGMDAVEKLSALMVHVTDIAGPDEDEE